MSDLIARLKAPIGVANPYTQWPDMVEVKQQRAEAAAALAAKDAEIEHQKRIVEGANTSIGTLTRLLDERIAEIAALRARLTVAITALRPFAYASEDLDDDERGELWEHPAAMSITCEDLRKALATYNSITKEPSR